MANEQNLKKAPPFHKRKDFKQVSSKGGRARTPAKKRAAKLREIKKGNVKGVDEHIRGIITDPEYCANDLAQYIEALKKTRMDARTKIQLGKLLTDRMKVLHGEKKKIEGKIEIEGSIFSKFKELE